MKKITLTQSSVSVLQACKRKYKLRYVDNLETVTKPTYLAIGTAFHRAVEVFRKGGSLDDMKRAALAPYVDLGHDDLVVLHAMVTAYHNKYGHEAAYHEVEKEWRLDCGSYTLAADRSISSCVRAVGLHHSFCCVRHRAKADNQETLGDASGQA
mgnify:CR=1 FL=1